MNNNNLNGNKKTESTRDRPSNSTDAACRSSLKLDFNHYSYLEGEENEDDENISTKQFVHKKYITKDDHYYVYSKGLSNEILNVFDSTSGSSSSPSPSPTTTEMACSIYASKKGLIRSGILLDKNYEELNSKIVEIYLEKINQNKMTTIRKEFSKFIFKIMIDSNPKATTHSILKYINIRYNESKGDIIKYHGNLGEMKHRDKF